MRYIDIKEVLIVLNMEDKIYVIDVFDSSRERKMKIIGVSGTLYTEHPRLLSNTCHTPVALPQHSNSHPQQNNFCMTSSCAARRRTSGIV